MRSVVCVLLLGAACGSPPAEDSEPTASGDERAAEVDGGSEPEPLAYVDGPRPGYVLVNFVGREFFRYRGQEVTLVAGVRAVGADGCAATQRTVFQDISFSLDFHVLQDSRREWFLDYFVDLVPDGVFDPASEPGWVAGLGFVPDGVTYTVVDGDGHFERRISELPCFKQE